MSGDSTRVVIPVDEQRVREIVREEMARQPAIAPINFGELVMDYVDRREVLEGRTGFPAPQSPAGGDDGQ